ncbi:MAG: glutathione S-transferase family protein [Sphingomonadales bacterium]|nr:glutathione S-transferase family protein [Sphingomonadales bacterium]
MPILHHCAGARSFRCLWAAEEAGFPIDLRMLPFPPRVFAPAFKDVNPLGTIPAWEENGHIITESAAICERIAHGTPLAVTPDEADWLPYLNWMHRSDATLTFPQTIVLRYTRLEPKERRLPQAAEDYLGFFLGRAKSIERALADGREFLVAGRFTMADVTVAYAITLAQSLKIDGELGPLTKAWYARLSAREGFKRAREREGGGTSIPE